MIVHIAETEKHKLTSFKRLKSDYVSENYGIFAAIITPDNANSSVRIKGLYDALHMTTSVIGLSLLYLLPATLKSMITHPPRAHVLEDETKRAWIGWECQLRIGFHSS
jgi:hypothetical protein